MGLVGTVEPMAESEVEFVGRVIGTEDSTPLSFWVAIAPDQYLQLDDVVVTDRDLPGDAESVRLAGVVTQVRARQEGARFDSDVFLIADGVLPAETVEAAEVSTTRIEPETFVPPRPGAPVRRAVGEERDRALLFDTMDRRLPIGLGRDGEALYANVDFLDGTRGAHVSISGVSGVATKTTYATFLLYSMFRSGVLGSETANTKALIFNVKGEDLLFLDRANLRLDEESIERYRKLGLPADHFSDVAFKAPPRRNDPNAGPDTASRTTGVSSFYWTIADFVTGELLPFVFADAEDERQQYTMVIHQVMRRLSEGEPVGEDGKWRVELVTLTTYHDLVELVVERLNHEDPQVASDWAGRAVGMGTINAFVRRLLSSQRALGSLIRADIPRRPDRAIDTTGGKQVTVVDIHNLTDRAQRFVVGVTIKRAFEAKEETGQRKPLLFIVLDELNKYAPREGTSPIKEILLDVAERGRSLGMILIGAQQTASEVERRVIANCAIRVAGRLDPAEATRPEYGFLPTAHRERARIAKPGTMFVSQPQLPVPLVVEFPFPAWATRPEEAAPDPGAADPFSGLP